MFSIDNRGENCTSPSQASAQQETEENLEGTQLGKADGTEPPGSKKAAKAADEVQDTAQTTPLEPLVEHSLPKPKKKEPEKKQEFQVSERSHVGAVRNRNEDTCFTFISQSGGHASFPPFGLFVVADGMGGHVDGNEASKIVSRTFAGHVLEQLYLPLLHGNRGAPKPIQEVMEEAVRSANAALHIPETEKEMGTTLTATLIFGNRLFLVHVGDSRAYLLTENDGLRPVTTDHSVVQALQDAGQLTAEEAAEHPNRNLLYRALMGEELEPVDVFTRSLPKRGMLMLCSDGLWGLVADSDMQRILSRGEPLAEKADALVQMALEAGGHDNITVVLVDFKL